MMDVENFNSAAAVAAVASAASTAAAVLGHQQPHSGSGNGGSQNQQGSPGGGNNTGTALGVANKNPFAIQELLGLGSNDHQVRRALISGKKLAC